MFYEHGADLELSRWAAYIGSGSSFDAIAHLESVIGRAVDRARLENRRRARYLAEVNSKPLMPGALERLDEARSLGLSLGVASSSSRGWVEGHLERLGVLDRFEAIKARDDVARTKPDPEVYLSVVEALGSSPPQAAAIEDSAHGLAAARAAGLFCVAVPNEMTRHLRLDEADLQVESLAGFTIAELIRRFG